MQSVPNFKNFHFPSWSIPISLLFLCLITYGLLIPRLGFYWDDWPSIWFLHMLGPSSFQESFAIDRPLLAWVFMFTTRLAGKSMLAWQILGLLARWMTSLALFWTMSLLWPRHKFQAVWIALLFAVYPGFSQQYISVTYGNAFLVYFVYILSLGAMILAFRKPRWFWPMIIFSVLASAFSIFTSEYFFGLELLRPFILWIALGERVPEIGQRVRKVLLYWVPYAFTLILFVIWRVFIHHSPRAKIVIFDQLLADPLSTINNLLLTILQDFYEVTLLAWAQTLNIRNLWSEYGLTPILIVFVILVGAFAFTVIFLMRLRGNGSAPEQYNPQPSRGWARDAMVLGALALFFGGWPIWVTNLHIELIFSKDRFTLPMMIGCSILITGFIELVRKTRLQSAVALGVLVALGAGMHFQNAMAFRSDWLALKSFFWQLTWRAPEIEPGTTILTSALPFKYYSDNSLTAPLNWAYAPDYSSGEMPYMFYDIESRLGVGLSGFEEGLPIEQPYRATSFSGSTSKAFVLFYDPPRCVIIMDPVKDLNVPYKPLYIRDALPLSKPEFIQGDTEVTARPPTSIFGEEPEPDWCYYFEKADLASQMGDWEKVVELGDKAFELQLEFTRETANELIPFVEGYAHVGNWDRAISLSTLAYGASPKMQNMLCATWYFLQEETNPSPSREAAVAIIRDKIGCKLP
jgi:hypothetical protein